MSYIDAMIAQGGGIDLSQITQSAQMAKQNDLLNLQRQNAIEQAPILQQRATTEYDQGQEDRDFQMKVRSAGMYTSLYEAGDIAGALNVFKDTLSKAQQTPESQQQIQKIMAALQTGDPNDDKIVADELYKNAKPVSQWGQKSAEGFTLAEGAQRFDAAGNPIANNPKTQEQVRAATPQEIAQAYGPNSGIVGAQVGADGKFINIQRATDKVEGAGDVRSRKISDLMEQGLTKSQAVNLVDGYVKQEISEKTGKVVKLDQVANTASEVSLSGGSPETPTPREGQTLRELANVATGIVPGITSSVAAGLALGNVDTSEKATAAQQTFQTHTTALIRALSINPRFPVAEMERIQKEVNIKPSMFQGGPTLIKKIDSLDESLQLRLDQAARDANDPNLDVETRQAQGANASALKNFLAILGGNPEDSADPITSEILKLKQELGID